jgi:signal transduction histidine kinase
MHLPKPAPYLVPILVFCLCQNNVQGQSVLIQQQLRGLPFIKDGTVLINSLNRLGTLYITKNLDSSFYYSGKAKHMAARQHYKKGQTDADNVIARALAIRGLNKESLELYSKVLAGYRQQLDTADLAPAMLNMAFVYMGLGDSTKAWALCRQAVQIGGKLKQDSTMSRVYAYYPLLMGLSADSTDYYLDKSRGIAIRYKDEQMLIINLQRQAARLLDNKDRRPELLLLINESLAASRKAGLIQNEIISLNYYAYYYQNNPAKVLKIHQQVYKLIQEQSHGQDSYYLKIILHFTELTGNKDEIIRIHGLLEKAMEQDIANLKKFIGDYVKYNAIQDDNTQLELTNKSNRTRIWLLLIICSITILLVMIMYRLYRVSRRLNRQISEQNTHMQKALTALEQSQADNTRMMQIVAHDLRNPIGGMFSIASMMLDEERPEEDRMLLELIRTSGKNSLDLVSDLLQVHTKVEELKKEPVDLSQMLHYCVDLLRHKAEAKGQQIDLLASAVIIPANREKLWRVVSNLIANAIKFSPTGAAIRVSLLEQADRVRIAVEDHGIGIPQEIAPKIFDMFTDAKRAGTAGEQPFGLGLAISKQIVEAHGGKLWFESKPGNGTIFFVELPLAG